MSSSVRHPVVARQDWLSFSASPSIYFSNVIGREAAEIPFWLVPLARGVVVAGPYLFRLTAYRDQRQDWVQPKPDVYQRTVGKTRLRVRRTNDGRLWIISRWPPRVKMHSDRDSQTLVYLFGSTPVVTDDFHTALHLAHWFEVHPPVASIRWANVAALYEFGALAFAIKRAESEGPNISWNDLWASAGHSRRIKRGGCQYKDGVLLPPMLVRAAQSSARSPLFSYQPE